ncbi:hypothetical protein GOY17_02425 [Lysobacter soli]|uniref:hypothetical protein n=1 Tax=Lysobacter soli TaxID=453783 RepID=UPI0012ECE7EB|nr:hypothetical protein [Lysobacter soli]QGW63873.1 hypothetical protein GOY17_02425 [Lysobacter soli]
MKEFVKNFIKAIPLALGVVLTALSMVAAIHIADDSDYVLGSLISGLIGVPLLFASATSLLRSGRA